MTATALSATDFAPGVWQTRIDVRDFIRCNWTPYTGDATFLEGPTARTEAVWEQVAALMARERAAGPVKEQNGAAMSLGRTATFLDCYLQRELAAGVIDEAGAQELVDDFVIKLRMVRFLRTPDFDELFSGDPTWVTEALGGIAENGRPLVTKTSFRYLQTLYNLGPAPEPNLTVLWSPSCRPASSGLRAALDRHLGHPVRVGRAAAPALRRRHGDRLLRVGDGRRQADAVLRRAGQPGQGAAVRHQSQFPTYGNDDDRADSLAVRLVQTFMAKVRRHPTYRDAAHTQSVLTITSNVVYGHHTGATPDGRAAGEPFAPGANPTYGHDHHGLVASALSVAKLPYDEAEDGISLTTTVTPSGLGLRAGERVDNLVGVLDGYMASGGFHMNVDVLDRATLHDAMEHPERYPQLTIRVSGYAVNFVRLTREQQLDVINRTFHEDL